MNKIILIVLIGIAVTFGSEYHLKTSTNSWNLNIKSFGMTPSPVISFEDIKAGEGWSAVQYYPFVSTLTNTDAKLESLNALILLAIQKNKQVQATVKAYTETGWTITKIWIMD